MNRSQTNEIGGKHATGVVVLLLAVLGVLWWTPVEAREQKAERPGRVRAYIDCQTVTCDLNFFQLELPFVDYVRDRQVADVHVLITTEATGAAGTAFTVSFLGQQDFADLKQRLQYVAQPDASEDSIRRGLSRVLKLGLVPYVAQSDARDDLQIIYAPGAAAPSTTSNDDPWNQWVFRTRLNAMLNAEKSMEFTTVSGGISGARTTEEWKLQLATNIFYQRNTFALIDNVQFTSVSRNYAGDALVVRSVGRQWAAGMRASLGFSTFLNQDLAFRWAPAVEYNLFPFAESTSRQLTVQYATGFNIFNYVQPTIFDKTAERLVDQSLAVALTLRQPWGSVSTAVEGSAHLANFGQNRLVTFADLDLRLFKGFSLNVNGSALRIRDQIYLPRRRPTFEQVLLRQQQLETSYQYFFSIGFSYVFGSIYNSVVNSRFAGARGGSVQTF